VGGGGGGGGGGGDGVWGRGRERGYNGRIWVTIVFGALMLSGVSGSSGTEGEGLVQDALIGISLSISSAEICNRSVGAGR